MGSILKIKGSRFWYIRYARNGKRYQESTKSTAKGYAKKLLVLREGQIQEGKFPGLLAQKTKIEQLMGLYLKDRERNHSRCMSDVRRFVRLVDESFGGMLAVNLTTQNLLEYRDKRTNEGVQDSTINRELTALRRGFNLGMKHDPPLVARIPNFPLVQENNVRSGFFELDEFQALRGVLPDHYKVIVSIAYYTGMRSGEVMNLKWKQVNWTHKTLTLDPGTTKNKQGRTIPLLPELISILEKWLRLTKDQFPECEWICHKKGQRVKTYRRAWGKACLQVGLEGRLFHDLRRSAVRNLVRAGVPTAVAKAISGHKTDSVFQRYNIVSETDLKLATERLDKYINEKKMELETELKG